MAGTQDQPPPFPYPPPPRRASTWQRGCSALQSLPNLSWDSTVPLAWPGSACPLSGHGRVWSMGSGPVGGDWAEPVSVCGGRGGGEEGASEEPDIY